MKLPKHLRGFTLIELMIVVIIIAILASIALPSYQESVRKSRRTVAKADLLELAQMAERHFTTNTSYATFTIPSGMDVSPKGSNRADYQITLTTGATTFSLVATAQGGQANDRCGNLGLNHQGRKTHSAGTFAECW